MTLPEQGEFEEVARAETRIVTFRTPAEWKDINVIIGRLTAAHNHDMDAARKRIAELEAELLDITRILKSREHRICMLTDSRSRYKMLVQRRDYRIANLEAENSSVRALMNCYNIGGWTDSLSYITKLEAENAQLRADKAELRPLIRWYNQGFGRTRRRR